MKCKNDNLITKAKKKALPINKTLSQKLGK